MSLLDALKQSFEKRLKQMAPVDPARFGDPMALKTAWTPARWRHVHRMAHAPGL